MPDEAEVNFSLRGASESLLDVAERGIKSVRPHDERVELEVERWIHVPAFEMRDDNYAFDLAQRAAMALGLSAPKGVEARGASDVNQVAPVIPDAIEGLGGWGGGLHSAEQEYVELSSLVPSVALGTLMTATALEEIELDGEEGEGEEAG